jgi:cysteine desulfurase
MKEIYLDYAATTYLDPRVKKAMEPYWEESFGNPSSLYKAGRKAKEALDKSRAILARILHSQPSEIIFTSSGTESANLAILGVCKAWEETGMVKLSLNGKVPLNGLKRHLVTSQIEHKAVLSTFQYLEKKGYTVSYLPVNKEGLVDLKDLKKALRPETLLVSIMYANNEVGTIQPIKELAAICRERSIYFHTDACQATGFLELDVQKLGVDMMTINSSKIYGPKGVGALYLRQGVRIKPLLYGGGQEKGLHSGTENVPGVIGFAKALELIDANKAAENKRLMGLQHYFLAEIKKRLPDAQLNGHATKRLPNNINLSFPGVEAEALVLLLDELGIACATGAACDTQSSDPSHVMAALGLSAEQARSALRLTMGKRTSKTDLEYVVRSLVAVVKRLQQ